MILKADLHIHSKYSNKTQHLRYPKPLSKLIVDSKLNVKDILQKCKDENLNVISITDHDCIDGSLEAITLSSIFKITIIPGVEITTKDGHLIAYNVFEKIRSGMSIEETIDNIRELGGIAVAPHVFSPQGIFFKFRNIFQTVGYKIDAIDVYSSLKSDIEKRALNYAKNHLLPVIIGSDSKTLSRLGAIYTKIDSVSYKITDIIDAILNKNTSLVIENKSNLILNAVDILKSNYLAKDEISN